VAKARLEFQKAQEIAFILSLELQNKRITLDEKGKEVRERKKKIIEQKKNKSK